MKKIDISVITLNYNAGNLIIENLKHLKKTLSSDLTIEVIVADNASTDDSFTRIKKEFPWVKTVDNKGNIGFAAGNNRAITKAKGKFIAFLNPDMRIDDAKIWKKLIKIMDNNPKIGALGCTIVFPDGDYDSDSRRGFPTPWNSFAHFSKLSKVFKGTKLFDSYYLGYLDANSEHEVDAIPGSFMFIRREAGEQVNWWDEDYFFYGEDLDLCFRLKQAGWKIWYTPKVKIVHYKGVTSGIRKESQKITTASIETKKRISKASVDAMRIFYTKHYAGNHPFWIKGIVHVGFFVLEKQRIYRYGLHR